MPQLRATTVMNTREITYMPLCDVLCELFALNMRDSKTDMLESWVVLRGLV